MATSSSLLHRKGHLSSAASSASVNNSQHQQNLSSILNSNTFNNMTGGTSAISLGMPATTASASSAASNASTNASSMKQQQRSLIIQKDERGFGFKVSGSNPVEVAFVTEGGAADRAGVRPGDKIVKVNGTRVFNSDHSVVVRTIKDAGSYVALTVISPAPISSGVPGTEDTSLGQTATSGVLNLANSSTNSSNSLYANNNIGTQQISGLANDASSSNPLVSTLPPSIAALSHLSQQPSQCQQSYLVSSSSLRSTRPLSPITTGIDSATVSSTTNLLDQNSPPSSSSHGNSRPGLTSGPSITSPLPAPESVQLECEKTREKTLKEYIRKDKELLSSLIASNAPQEQIDGTKDRLNLLKRNLKLVRGKRSFMPRNIFTSPGSNTGALNFSSNHPHLQHMSSSTTHLLSPESMYGSSIGGFSGLGSNDDIASASKGMFDPSVGGGILNPAIASSVSTAPQGPSSSSSTSSFWSRGLHSSSKYSKDSASGSSNRKSHSFKDELLREPKETILSMESDDEEDDEADEGDAANTAPNEDAHNEGTNEMLNANILNLAAQKKNESKSNRNRKKSKDLLEEPDISDIEDLTNALLNHKKLIISNVSGSNTSSSASASASTVVSKNPKEKINGRRKGSSSRASFMSSSISAEEQEWLKESKKLMFLISHSLNSMRTDIDYLLFYTLATLIQRELTVTTTSSSTSASASASASSPSSSPSQIVKPGTKEALFELISIFLLPDSPLTLTKLPPHLSTQTQWDLLTSSCMVSSCPSSPSNATSTGNSGNTCQLQDLLTPYINCAREVVNEGLIKPFNKAKEMGLLQSSVFMSLSAKEKKKPAREFMGRLLTEAIQFLSDANPNLPAEANFFSEGDSLVSCLKGLLQGQPLKGDQTDSIPYSHTMARLLSLLSTFYHFLPHSIFLPFSSAIHCELEPFILLNTLITSKPGGPGGTSGHNDSSGPRHKSLPSSLGSSIAGTFAGSITSPTGLPLPVASSGQSGKVEIDSNFILTAAKQPAQAGGGKKGKSAPATVSLIPAGHLISSPPFTTLSSIAYCSACGHLLWGKPNYLLICSRCKVKCHYWCYFTSIHNNTSTMYPCLPVDGSNVQGPNSNYVLTNYPNTHLGHHYHHSHSHPHPHQQHHHHHHQRAHSAVVSKNESSRRSFFFPDPSKIFKSNNNQTKSTSSFFQTDAHKLQENSPFYSFISSSSSSSSYSSSSSSTDSESDSNLDEDDYVSASSDPSTPILKSKIKRIKKTKRSKSLEEGVIASSVATSDGDASGDAGNSAVVVTTTKSKEYEQANEEEAKEKRMAKLKIRKKLKQRKMNTLEFIRTEKSFGKKLLLLHDLFYVQIVRSPGLLTKDEINILFSNHLQLMDLHSKLYGQLRERLRPCLNAKRSKVDWKYVANAIEYIFTELGPSLKEEVAVFCSNFIPANELLKAKMKSSKMFSILLSEAESASALNKLKLTDLLAAPFQRIMRYPLLVAEIRNTFDSLVDSSNGKFARKEAEARSSFDSALTVIKAIVHGVNRRKSEFEFLSWFKSKVAPFYPKYADLSIDSLRLVAEGQVTWRFNREKSFSGHLLLLPDLLLILTQENSSNQVPSSSQLPMGSSTVTSSTSLMSVNSSASNTSTSPSVGSTVSTATNATTSLNFSFLSKQLQEREASGATFVLKEAPVDGDKNPQTHTTVPVLEVTTDVSTRAHAINRTAFFLFSKGASGGQKSGSSAAMYELITVSEQAREALTECIINLVESKKQGGVTSPVTTASVSSSSTNPFLPSYQDQQQQQQQQANQPVPPTPQPHTTADTHSIRNRPLPPLPTSASLQGVAALSTGTRQSSSSSSHSCSHHSSMIRRSRSQDPGERNIAISDQGSSYVNLTPATETASGHCNTSSTPANGAMHPPPPPPPPPPQPNLPPFAGVRGILHPGREPLASYQEVNSIQPDVRFAQRVNVIGGDSFYDDQTEYEQQLNGKILDLLRERRNLISAKKNTSSTNDHTNSETQLADCIGSLALDAFTYELMLSTNDCDNDKSELRAKLINSLSKIA